MAEEEKPANCGECKRFDRNREKPRHGWCPEWAGVDLTEDCVCHPNIGRKKGSEAANGND